MSRARRLSLVAAALAALAGCGDNSAPAPAFAFRQPSALAVFGGFTLDDPASLRPYLAVANASRNDLTIVDASDGTIVGAPVELRALAIPVAERPALLAAAPLGDGGPDLLVVASAGSSVLQLVRTWSPANDVVDAASVDLAIELGRPGADVVALAALPAATPAPPTPGTARIAVALAGSPGGAPADRPEVVVVEYSRVAADAPAEPGGIAPGAVTRSGPLAFQPLALAALPDDDDPATPGVQTEIYAATRDAIAPGVFGVAAFSPDDLAAPRALDARGPTRLVAAARLWERAGSSTASDASAFPERTAASAVPRVYAVLDEAGCGPTRRIDCGVVTLDPAKLVAPGDDAIPEDWAGRMPYRAPMRVPARALALAVARPPAVAPPENAAYAGDLMRLLAGVTERATTRVAAVASSDGNVYFLDLGRFETVTAASPLATRIVSADATTVDPDGDATAGDEVRLWFLADPAAATFPEVAADAVQVRPGYTPNDTFALVYQGTLPGLAARRAVAGVTGGGQRWLALQAVTAGTATDVVKVYHPALGVRGDTGAASADGDVVQLSGGGLAAPCEARVASLLAPQAEFPGGALALAEHVDDPADPGDAPDAEEQCAAAVFARPDPGAPLTATVLARGLVLAGAASGYAGRPERGAAFALEYPEADDEDQLAGPGGCPAALADWDGSFPPATALPACDASCRAACERLVLARKARRVHHLSYPCDEACQALYPGVAFPEANGPALGFTVDVQRCPGRVCDPARPSPPDAPLVRGMVATVAVGSGVSPLLTRASPASPFFPAGAVAFDRSPASATAGYRFLVAYPSDLVYDVSPSVSPVSTTLVR